MVLGDRILIESRPEFDKITSFDEFNKYYWYREELSGGQWQKIAIARTMYRKSSLLLFDEPSSSLDIISEKIIFDNILNNLNDKIIIYITHRIRCAMNSDRIIVMDNGKIVGDGSHDDLIENCNRYKLMYNKEFK